MCSQCAALAVSAVAILAAIAKPLATGWLYNVGHASFIFPFTATQCEPFYIYYNTPLEPVTYFFYDPTTLSNILFFIHFPKGAGYVDWICNIPAGIGFNVYAFNYTVQPGSSSACLGNVTATYSILTYFTAAFAPYTRTASPLITPLTTITLPTATFPTGAYSTITVNPNLAVTPTTSPPSSSSPSSSSPGTLPSHKAHIASVAGGVVGAVAFVIVILTLVFWRKRRRSVLARASSPIDPQPSSISGLATGELGFTDLSSTLRFSGAEFLGGTQQYPISPPNPYSHGAVPTSDNLIVVPVTGNPAALVDPIAGQKSSQGITTPFVAEPALPSQQPRKPRNNGRQPSQPGPSPDMPSRTPPAVEQQPPYTQSFDTPADVAPETSRPGAILLSQQPSTSETQEGPVGFTAVLGIISRAQLSETERLAAIRLLGSDPSGQPDLARQNTLSSPPPYTE